MAIGMKKIRLGLVITIESIMLSFMGVIFGAIATVPVILYFFHHPLSLSGSAAEATVAFGFEPIMPVSLDPMILIWQALAVLIIALVASTYPWYRIGRLKAVSAMRSV